MDHARRAGGEAADAADAACCGRPWPTGSLVMGTRRMNNAPARPIWFVANRVVSLIHPGGDVYVRGGVRIAENFPVGNGTRAASSASGPS
jgi:hypothetical protein